MSLLSLSNLAMAAAYSARPFLRWTTQQIVIVTMTATRKTAMPMPMPALAPELRFFQRSETERCGLSSSFLIVEFPLYQLV